MQQPVMQIREPVPQVPESTRKLLALSVSENTRSSYENALNKLERWLDGKELTDVRLAEYISERYEAGDAPQTISMVVAAVKFSARLRSIDSPVGVISERTMSGVRKDGWNRGSGQVSAITFEQRKQLVQFIEDSGPTPKTLRDVAIFCIMSEAMLRTSEVLALYPKHIELVEDGTGRLTIEKSKTDSEGKGAVLFLSENTMDRVLLWIQEMKDQGKFDTAKHLFRRVIRNGSIQNGTITPRGFRKIIKTWTEKFGMKGRFAGHSFRVGTAQSLAKKGATLIQMQKAGRWKNADMPAYYIRNVSAADGAVAKLLVN